MNVTEKALDSGWVVLSVLGRVDAQSAPALEERCQQVADRASRLALDMSQVHYISSAGLRVLFASLKNFRSRGGDMALVAPQASVSKILEIAGFNSVFKIVNSDSELK